MLVFAAGLVDDLAPAGPRGLRNHVRGLAAGHVSTGVVKVVVIVAAALVAIALQPGRSGWIRLAGAVLVAASANVWNGLDVRPGRAIKFGLVASLGLVGVDLVLLPTLPGVVLGSAAGLWFDLHERAMLGDGGANLLGFTVGLGLYQVLPDPGVVVAAVVAVAINAVAETVNVVPRDRRRSSAPLVRRPRTTSDVRKSIRRTSASQTPASGREPLLGSCPVVKAQSKFIFVTGGVASGLGKGITTASLGRLFKSRGLKVVVQKLDPYINVDPGTMNPFEHGEVFVLDDGAETDLDLGHYERFSTRTSIAAPTSRRAPSTRASSRRSAAATTWARPCRSSRTSPTRSRSGSARSPRPSTPTSSSSRSAERSATSSRSRSSKPSVSSGTRSAATTARSCTCRSCRSSAPPAS